MTKRLEEELKDRLGTRRLERLSGTTSSSCISQTCAYNIDEEKKVFVKINSSLNAEAMFEGESESLKHIISTNTIRAPKPLAVIHNYDSTPASAIAMEFLSLGSLTNESAKNLGISLAHLHDYNNKVIKYKKRASKWIGGVAPSVKAIKQTKNLDNKDDSDQSSDSDSETNQFTKHSMRVKGNTNNPDTAPKFEGQYPDRFVPEPSTEEISQFGFHVPTACGSILQVNEWTDDWVAFYARHRLDKVIRSLLSDHGDRELSQEWSHLQLKVDKFFTDYERKGEDIIIPALLHGDLWSGNLAQLGDGPDGVVYDPSSFYGHSEYDFGIARMFGGTPKDFEESYFKIMPKKKLFEKRSKLYQFFHHLNHWEHFGSGYRPSSLRLIKDLNSSV